MSTELVERLIAAAERIDKVFDHGRLTTQEWEILVQAIQALRQAAADSAAKDKEIRRLNDNFDEFAEETLQSRLDEINAEADAYDKHATKVLTRLAERVGFEWPGPDGEGLTVEHASDLFYEHLGDVKRLTERATVLRQSRARIAEVVTAAFAWVAQMYIDSGVPDRVALRMEPCPIDSIERVCTAGDLRRASAALAEIEKEMKNA